MIIDKGVKPTTMNQWNADNDITESHFVLSLSVYVTFRLICGCNSTLWLITHHHPTESQAHIHRLRPCDVTALIPKQ